jgi:hypothetical protein
MPREHTEFVQAQMLPWLDDHALLPGGCVKTKLLSEDPDSGARTSILRYPAGHASDVSYGLACDEEMYVLDGSMRIGEFEYMAGDYACLPAGYGRELQVSSSGCDVLSYHEAAPDPCAPGSIAFQPGKLIERIRTAETDWGAPSDETVAAIGAGRILLRTDPESGDLTWLLRFSPTGGKKFEINAVETHPCVEEVFLLGGEIALREGVLRTGAYFWRPPHIPHGPMGTREGFVGIFRAKEGEFTTEWSEPDGEIPWDADYDPVLPDSTRAALIDPPGDSQRY